MKAIFIGAGRGSRLMPHTDDRPKCLARVGDRPILDWITEAVREAGVDEIVFVGGYLMERVREAHPEFTFRHNPDWQDNNILVSLFCAEDCMAEGFLCSYVDILYRPSLVERLLAHPADITICVDTDWKQRYSHRTQHPPDDAEKVAVRTDRVLEISRTIPTEAASGEYIGLARFSPEGAEALRTHYHRARQAHQGRPFRSADSFDKAYLIDLYQEMIEAGVEFRVAATHGQYMEIDTQEDYELSQRLWH